MMLVSLEFHARRDKRGEFLRTAENFVATLRQSQGCLDCRLLADCEVHGAYTLTSQWEGREAVRRFLQSDDFRALLGTKILLREAPQVSIDEVLRSSRQNGSRFREPAW